MNRFVSSLTGFAAATALVLAGGAINLHAQRGGPPAGHGAPATHGAPTTATQPGHPEHPTPPAAAGHAGDADKHADATHPDADKTAKTGGRPTVGDQLSRNTNLATSLQGLFPAGTDLQKEAAGFRNLGQFVAAAHVAHNLDIPFDQLKAKMTGTGAVSLGKAISELKPDANAKTETDKAETEARADMKPPAKPKTTAKTE